MEQVSFQQQQFQGIVPVLDVGDPSRSLAESQQYLVNDQNSALAQIQRDGKIAMQNTEAAVKGMQELAELSQSAGKVYANFKNNETKKEASRIWAEEIANAEDPKQIELAKGYQDQEKEQSKLESQVDSAVSTNLVAQKEPTATDSARAGRVRQSAGLYSTVRANARAYAAMDSYGPAFDSYVKRFNQREVEKGRMPVEPGSPQWQALRSDFDQKWAEQTGMSMANSGFSAAYVYPKLRQEMGRRTETYTRAWNVGHADRQTDIQLQQLTNKEISLEEFVKRQKGLTRADGVSLKTNNDVWATLEQARLTPDQLASIEGGQNPITKQDLKLHPRFQALMTNARKRELEQYNLTVAQQKQQALEAFAGLKTPEQILNRAAELDRDGIPAYIVNEAKSKALQATDDAERDAREDLETRRAIEALPEGAKLPAGYFDDKSYRTRQTFMGYMADSDKKGDMDEKLRATDTFKSIDKDFKGIVGSLGATEIKFGDALTGGSDPANYNVFKQDSLDQIVTRAQSLMLSGDNVSQDSALRQAVEEWKQDAKQKVSSGEFFDVERNEFKGSSTTINSNLQEATRIQIDKLNSTTHDNLSHGLQESDWTQLPANGQYSGRVKYLGRAFSLTPEEVVNTARAQRGLPPLEPTPAEVNLRQIPPAERARITALDDEAPISLAIRAQINSGQVLNGNAKQRTVAVGQNLLTMGYGGIWQHPDFNYDSGFTGSGTEEVGTHKPNSFHKYNEALDIGVQANGHHKLETLYQYLLKNKKRFGISELFYDPRGDRGHPAGHDAHVHVAFGGGESGTMQQ